MSSTFQLGCEQSRETYETATGCRPQRILVSFCPEKENLYAQKALVG